MTVTDIVRNFRLALVGLVPRAEHVRVPWRSSDAYDGWDDIASALFEGLVVEPLRYSAPGVKPELVKLPNYDLLLESYGGMGVIEVPALSGPGHLSLLHAFETRREPFDTLRCITIALDGVRRQTEPATHPIDSLSFAFRPWSDGQYGKPILSFVLEA